MLAGNPLWLLMPPATALPCHAAQHKKHRKRLRSSDSGSSDSSSSDSGSSDSDRGRKRAKVDGGAPVDNGPVKLSDFFKEDLKKAEKKEHHHHHRHHHSHGSGRHGQQDDDAAGGSHRDRDRERDRERHHDEHRRA